MIFYTRIYSHAYFLFGHGAWCSFPLATYAPETNKTRSTHPHVLYRQTWADSVQYTTMCGRQDTPFVGCGDLIIRQRDVVTSSQVKNIRPLLQRELLCNIFIVFTDTVEAGNLGASFTVSSRPGYTAVEIWIQHMSFPGEYNEELPRSYS